MKTQSFLVILLIFSTLFFANCASQIILNDKQPTPEPVAESTPEIPVDDFTERLQSVQTGNFNYVFVFRRMDGEVFTDEDRKILRENTENMNQRQLTSDKKALILGSNYAFPPENLDALKKRFKIEDYSPKKEEPVKEQNKNKKEQNTNINR